AKSAMTASFASSVKKIARENSVSITVIDSTHRWVAIAGVTDATFAGKLSREISLAMVAQAALAPNTTPQIVQRSYALVRVSLNESRVIIYSRDENSRRAAKRAY
ncbi:MAG TPA: hypothetical protein VJL90_05755, partial [Pseudorhodoplanes sp.]|nr:hypothetical protein [Pseudorhodoplanes sp.]